MLFLLIPRIDIIHCLGHWEILSHCEMYGKKVILELIVIMSDFLELASSSHSHYGCNFYLFFSHTIRADHSFLSLWHIMILKDLVGYSGISSWILWIIRNGPFLSFAQVKVMMLWYSSNSSAYERSNWNGKWYTCQQCLPQTDQSNCRRVKFC